MTNLVFNLKPPQCNEVPILISVPHSGVAFPEKEKKLFKEQFVLCPEDTDWFVDRLYDWAPEMGITVISAHYSRYVIDLNRDPQGASLYHDERVETTLCPLKSFVGENLYVSGDLTQEEIVFRSKNYFDPYHQELQKQLDRLQKKFGKVLLWDAHSIKRRVSLIRQDPFPDLILGSNDGASCSNELEDAVAEALGQGVYELSRNHPFKGGYITRNHGSVNSNTYALQLEMSQDIYMNEKEMTWNEDKSLPVKELLKNTLQVAIDFLKSGVS